MDIPRQFIFAYVDTLASFLNPDKGVDQIQFYIDPISGMVYTQTDVDTYLRKVNAHDREQYFNPLSTRRVIYKMLEELSLCYRYRREDQKAEEMQQLMQLLNFENEEDDDQQ